LFFKNHKKINLKINLKYNTKYKSTYNANSGWPYYGTKARRLDRSSALRGLGASELGIGLYAAWARVWV